MYISNFPISYYNPCRKDNDTTSDKSSLWVDGKIRDFACRLPLKASTLNLFNKVVHFDDASGFDGYIDSVEMYRCLVSLLLEYKSIKSREGLMVA